MAQRKGDAYDKLVRGIEGVVAANVLTAEKQMSVDDLENTVALLTDGITANLDEIIDARIRALRHAGGDE